jgi:hypothetical protein
MSWDPSDREIRVDWVLRKTDAVTTTLPKIEYVVASLLNLFVNESLIAFHASLRGQPRAIQEAFKPLLSAAKKRIEEFFTPPILAVLQRLGDLAVADG